MATQIPANKFKGFTSKSVALAFAKSNGIAYPTYNNTRNYNREKVKQIKQNLFINALQKARIQNHKAIALKKKINATQIVPIQQPDNLLLYSNTLTDSQKTDKNYFYHPLKNISRTYDKVMVVWKSNDIIKLSDVLDFSQETNFRKWMDKNFFRFNINSKYTIFQYNEQLVDELVEQESEGNIFDDYDIRERIKRERPELFAPNIDQVIIVKPTINQFNHDYTQYFLDASDGHCFFSPITNWINLKIQTIKDNKNYKILMGKVNKYTKQFDAGISASDIKLVANDLKISFTIKDILNNEVVHVKPEKKMIRNFTYVNTRYNHVDCIVNESAKDDKIISIDDMIKLKEQLDSSKEHYLYRMTKIDVGNVSVTVPALIIEKTNRYILKNDVNDIIKDFNISIGLDKLKYDFINESNKFNFISNGVRYISHFSYVDDIKSYSPSEYMEYDLRKAYTQGNKDNLKDYYVGYPTVMSQPLNIESFTLADIKSKPGYYYCRINKINNSDCNIIKHLNMVDIVVGLELTLTSPEILFFADLGIEFTFLIGSYCFKSIDIPFTEDMVAKKCYTKWGGMLNMANSNQVYCVDGERKYLDMMRDTNTNKDIHNFESEDGTYTSNISIKKKKAYTLNHVGGFVTAYCRINVFKKLFNEKFEDVLGYKLDGYVIKKTEDVKIDNIWQLKPAKIDFNWGMKPYAYTEDISKIIVGKYDTSNIIGNNNMHCQYLFLSGQGGSGKTHTYLSQRQDGIFTSRIWKLCVEKEKDYNVRALCINRLLTKDATCEPYLIRNDHPGFIFIDESNMIPIEWIDDIIKTFPYSQIILAGDLNDAKNHYYQCGFSDITNLFNDSRFNYIKFDKSYRCKDIQLQQLLEYLRQCQDKTLNMDEILGLFIKYVKDCNNVNIISENLVKDVYNYKTDWVLCSTKSADDSRSKFWTNMLKGKKYYITSHNETDILKRKNGTGGQLNGDIIIDPIDVTKMKGEYRDGFTIHSFQGITISGGRLYIDLKKMFDPRQLYTAISRVEYLDQIYLVK